LRRKQSIKKSTQPIRLLIANAFVVLMSLAAVCTYAKDQVDTSESNHDIKSADDPTPVILEEVIVTAERRAASLQRVPIAITALTGDQLSNSLINDTMELQFHVPGYVFKTNSVLGQPYIRGVGSDVITAGAESSVAFFVDNVYQTRAASTLQNFYDIERVEIVKGPQGTLFGRNATGGAVHIITNKPVNEFEANAELVIGSDSRIRLSGAWNSPLTEHVALRLAGLISNRDGYSKNVFLGIDVDDEKYYALRGHAIYQPANDLELLFSFDYSQDDSNRGLVQHPDPVNGINLGLIPPFDGEVRDDPREVTHNENIFADVKRWSSRLQLTKHFASVEFKSLTSYGESDFVELLDLDASNADFVSNFPSEISDVFTQEFQVASQNNRIIEWVAGVFYLKENAFQKFDIEIAFPVPGGPEFLPVRTEPSGDIKSEAFGIFAQGSYNISNSWRATLGARYSYDERRQHYRQVITDPFGILGGSMVIENDDRGDWNAWTPKVGVEYFHSDRVMAYGSIGRGYKAGGFNTTAFQSSFDEEDLWAYEIGLKTSTVSGRSQLNIASFYYQYNDIQLLTLPPGAPLGSFPIVFNAAGASYRGLEVEFHSRPTSSADINLSIAWLDAQFDEFVALDPNNPQNGEVDRAGESLPQAPELSVNASAQYIWLIEEFGSLTLRGEFHYQSKIFFNTFQDDVVSQNGYTLVNAQLQWENSDKRWSIALWVKNLTDELYANTIIRQDPLVGSLRFWGAPRTYGLQFSVRN
jgi:iron complex outermembrane receptor protein